jgi:hypothetical protein
MWRDRRQAAAIGLGRPKICLVGWRIVSSIAVALRVCGRDCHSRSTFEGSAVTRFGGQAITALVIWLGMAMLGQGSRACASFLPYIAEIPLSTTAAASCGAGGESAEFQASSDVPFFANPFGVLQADGFGNQRPTSGGAGSSSSNISPGSTGCMMMLVSGESLNGPTLSARLRARDALSIPDPLASAILEPPRAGC